MIDKIIDKVITLVFTPAFITKVQDKIIAEIDEISVTINTTS